jgi:hypothetical protein
MLRIKELYQGSDEVVTYSLARWSSASVMCGSAFASFPGEEGGISDIQIPQVFALLLLSFDAT